MRGGLDHARSSVLTMGLMAGALDLHKDEGLNNEGQPQGRSLPSEQKPKQNKTLDTNAPGGVSAWQYSIHSLPHHR